MLTYSQTHEPLPSEVERILATLTSCQSFEQQYETNQNLCYENAYSRGPYHFSKIDSLEYAWGPF